MPSPRTDSRREDGEALRRACELCRRKFVRDPNIIGVGPGLKVTRGQLAAGGVCLHVYVRRKLKRPDPRRRVPRFVCARLENGSPDRSRRIPTDVIELRHLSFACEAGAEVGVTGECGALTLLFRNKAPKQRGRFLITCAHVAGDVWRSPPADPQITCARSGGAAPVCATTLVNATARSGALDYDVALARVAPGHGRLADCRAAGSAAALTRFLPAEDLRAGMRLDCAFPASNVVAAAVASGRVTLPLSLDGREVLVNNLFLIDRQPRKGDSGGLLYDGTAAAGILVGMADGWGLFQPLGEAFAHLQALSPIPITCFKNKTARTERKNKT